MDASSGVQYEGESGPEASSDDRLALHVWQLVSNGQGGIDWSGLPFAVELLGVQDIEGLLCRLVAIKQYQPEPQKED